MKHVRIVWKDSIGENSPSNYKPIKYRKHFITGYVGGGWVTDLPNDRNIYKSSYCAQNAIDAALGGFGTRGKPPKKRLDFGVQIIGQLPESGTAQ